MRGARACAICGVFFFAFLTEALSETPAAPVDTAPRLITPDAPDATGAPDEPSDLGVTDSGVVSPEVYGTTAFVPAKAIERVPAEFPRTAKGIFSEG